MATVTEAIRAYESAQTAFNGRMSAAVDGIVSDVAALNALILQLQSTQGAITPEDQAILDRMQTAGEALTARVEAADALTPPPVTVPV